MNINQSTRKLTLMGVLLAVTIILDVTPLGAIPIGAVSATITHIPTIIAGILLGPIHGLAMGASLGIVSLIHAATRPVTPLDPLFINPLLSVLPRLFIGLASYGGYQLVSRLLKKRPGGKTLGAVVGGLLGSMTNTVLVLTMLYLVYVEDVIEAFNLADSQAVKALFLGIVTSNALIEAAVAAVITTAIVVPYFKLRQKRS